MRYYFVFLFVCFSLTIISAQVQLPVVVKTSNNSIIFENGDSLRLNEDEQLLFFVFHAEEDSIGLDPGLSTDGRWRAIHLKKLMQNFAPIQCLTTPFRRNILTLQPITDALNLKPLYYDQSALNVFFETLDKEYPGTFLILVHKETIDRIFETLVQKPFTEMLSNEPADRIFLIKRKKNQVGKLYAWQYRIR